MAASAEHNTTTIPATATLTGTTAATTTTTINEIRNHSSCRQHHMVHRSSTGQLMDSRRRRQREERERWLNQWASIWTKRQSPEWKPRRASVATCQQQAQQRVPLYGQNDQMQLQQQIYDLSAMLINSTTGGRYSSVDCNVELRKLLTQKQLQSRGNLRTLSACDVVREQQQQQSATNSVVDRGQSASGLRCATVANVNVADELRKLSLQEDLARCSGGINHAGNGAAGCLCSPAATCAVADDEAAGACSCSSGSSSSSSRSRLIEKLELQDKQRKSLILSMALRRQMQTDSVGCTTGAKRTGVLGGGGGESVGAQVEWQQQAHRRRRNFSADTVGEQVAAQVISAASETVSSNSRVQHNPVNAAQTVAEHERGITTTAASSTSTSTSTEAVATAAPLTCWPPFAADRNKGDANKAEGCASGKEPLDPGQLNDQAARAACAVGATAATGNTQDLVRDARMMSIVVKNCDRKQQQQQQQANVRSVTGENDEEQKENLNAAAMKTTTQDESQQPRRRLSSGLGADSSIHSTGSCEIEPNLSEFDDDDDEDDEDDSERQAGKTDNERQKHQKNSSSPAHVAEELVSAQRTRRCHCDSQRKQPQQQVSLSGEQQAAGGCADTEVDFESLIVESWLDDHPSFVHDYFMRKASRQLIDDWLVTHAKSAISANLQSAASFEHLRQPSTSPTTATASTTQLMRGDSDSAVIRFQLYSTGGAPATAAPSTLFEGQSLVAGLSPRCRSYTGGGRGTRSSSQSGQATPVRKISATDFESRTGSGFLRPMVSTTPDGKPTFLTASCHYDDGNNDNDDDDWNAGYKLHDYDLTSDMRADEQWKSRAYKDDEGKEIVSDSETLERRDSTSAPASTCDSTDTSADREMKLIFELVKNICNDLDINTLLHKILKNIAVLINADKSSLFLVCGEPGDPNRRLVSQLFNVDQEDSDFEGGEDSISIPWGTGLVGYVAASGESVNIDNCYDDPRFTNTIDQRTGYVTKHMLCAPILDKRNEIVGVAQVINKRDGKPFTKSDEIKFKRYLQFCGIGLRNAQSYENCQLENRRNQVLLDLARMVFEEQSTIEQVVYRIMLHTQSLLECQRCQVLLIDDGSSDLDHLLQLPSRVCPATSVASPAVGRAKSTMAVRKQQQQCAQPKPDWRPQCGQSGEQRANDKNNNSKNNGADNNNTDNNATGRHQNANGLPVAENSTQCRREDDDSSSSSTMSMRAMGSSQIATTTMSDNEEQSTSQMHQQQQQDKQVCSPKLFSLVFDLECDGNDLVMHNNKDSDAAQLQCRQSPGFSTPTAGTQRFPINIGITGYVAMTGETLNIEDAHLNERFDPSVDEGTNFRHKSILCMPIRNGQRQIIGVSQLINKKNGRTFNKNDEDLFEAFAIFCGLGIHNTLMYEKVLKIMAKQRVTFEVLSYHATAPLEEAKKLNKEPIPSCYALNLTSLKFNDFSLDEQFMLKSCLRFFLDLDLIRRFQIDQLVFCNWILSVQKNYRSVTYHPIVGGNGLKASPVRYHNWRHAFNVTQMMFAILINTQICQALGELETLALLIACLCHDLDHRGTNNSFQIKSASPLAELYSTSTMEHHHFDQCVMILNSQGNQILANLSPEEYSRVIVLLEEAILATDLANYFQKREVFFRLVNSNQFEWRHNQEHRSLLRCMLMTACDVAAITKPWPVQKVVADLVMSEFYQQGDIERQELNIEPIDMMNRDKMSKLPEMQIGFIDSICAPIYVAFARLFPNELAPLLDGCLSNRNLWTEIAKSNNNNNNNNDNNKNNNQAKT